MKFLETNDPRALIGVIPDEPHQAAAVVKLDTYESFVKKAELSLVMY